MRHRVSGRTFGRRPEQRKALMRGLATALLEHERITTTVEKAKELRKYVEPLITLAKRGDLHARRQAASFLYGREPISKLFSDIAQRFKERQGGYTRILKLGQRVGDGAKTAIVELLMPTIKKKSEKKKKQSTKTDESDSKENPKVKEEKTSSKTKKKLEKSLQSETDKKTKKKGKEKS